MLNVYRKLFEYDHWANLRVMGALDPAVPATDKSMQLMSHILGAKGIWLARLRGDDQAGMEVHPSWDHATCADRMDTLNDAWLAYLDNLDPTWLAVNCNYRTSKGKAMSTAVGDVLHHVVNHATHHRGQINSLLKAAGQEPPWVDFIVFSREQA